MRTQIDVFSASELEVAHSRLLSLLALFIKNSMILGCDRTTSFESRGMIRVALRDLMILDIVIMLVFFKLGKVPKTRLSKLAGGH